MLAVSKVSLTCALGCYDFVCRAGMQEMHLTQLPPPLPNPQFPPPPPQRSVEDDPAMRMLLPIGRSSWAIVSGYLGLISVLCIPAPFAILTGILAIRDMRRDPKLHGMGRAVFGIVMGSIFTIALFIWLVIFAVAQLQRE